VQNLGGIRSNETTSGDSIIAHLSGAVAECERGRAIGVGAKACTSRMKEKSSIYEIGRENLQKFTKLVGDPVQGAVERRQIVCRSSSWATIRMVHFSPIFFVFQIPKRRPMASNSTEDTYRMLMQADLTDHQLKIIKRNL